MRRLVYWFLPLGVALVAAVAFGAGFYSFLTGSTGSPVNLTPQTGAAAAAAPRDEIAAVVLGDSLGRGAGDATGLGIAGRLDAELRRRTIEARPTVNIAVNGAKTADLLRQLERPNVLHLISEANVVIISIGGNDLWGSGDWRNSPPPDPAAVMDEVLDRIERVVSIVRKANPNGRIFLVGLYNPFRDGPFGGRLTPHVTQWNARLIERFSADPNVSVVQTADIFSHRDRLAVDRFHPAGEGYELIARRIADAL